jgi:hypothetical protein
MQRGMHDAQKEEKIFDDEWEFIKKSRLVHYDFVPEHYDDEILDEVLL